MQQKNSYEIKEIAALVNRLMNHYWTADEPTALRQGQAEDWLEDLIEFSPALVAEACRRWRRMPGSRRPLPGDIRRLCIEEQTVQHDRRAISAPADMDEYARSVGWRDEAERREAIARDKARRNESRGAEMAADGREVSNNWARQQGYLNLKDYMKHHGLDYDNDADYAEACLRVIKSMPGPKTMPRAGGGKMDNPAAAAAALGVRAREYAPTPAEMRAGRIALGIEPADAGEAPA